MELQELQLLEKLCTKCSIKIIIGDISEDDERNIVVDCGTASVDKREIGGGIIFDLVFDSQGDLRDCAGALKSYIEYADKFHGVIDDKHTLLMCIEDASPYPEVMAFGINPVFYALCSDDVNICPDRIRVEFIKDGIDVREIEERAIGEDEEFEETLPEDLENSEEKE